MSGFEGRFDSTEPLQAHLHNLYQLRQQAGAEEWPMPSEPLIDEDGAPVKLMVIPSKELLHRDAQPIGDIGRNEKVHTLVVDRAIHQSFAEAVRRQLIPKVETIEFTEHRTGLIIALDSAGQFCGSYTLPGVVASLPQTTATPAGEVTVSLSELAAIAFAALASTWIAVHSIAVSISQ